MLLNVSKEMPKEGQFVAVWTYEGVPWSTDLKWSAPDYLVEYDHASDSWEDVDFDEVLDGLDCIFIKDTIV